MLNREECEKALTHLIECKKRNLCNKCKYKQFCTMDSDIAKINTLIYKYFELVEEYKKLEKSDASKEECTIEQHGEIKRLRSELKQLQDEVDKYKHEYYSMCDLFEDPQPYKFEELGKGRAFFDDILEVQAIIIDIDYESKRIISAYWLDKNDCLVTYDVEFEEGRFYPITKALEYQGKEDEE